MKKWILVKPPRLSLPSYNGCDNFLPTLSLPCIAATLRSHVPGLEVKIIDCPALMLGWKSLRAIIKKESPDVVGAGEEAFYHHESVRLFQTVKEILPGAVTVAGGPFFSWLPDYSLTNYPIDIIVHFEGEETAGELAQALEGTRKLSSVRGITYKTPSGTIKTPSRTLCADLDDLPMPAFDLMRMSSGRRGGLWPLGITLEHSRGCTGACSFCSLWTFWGKHGKTDVEKGELEVSPCYRTKSVGRTLEEIDIAYNKYGRKVIFWADPTFNVDPSWTDEFCERLISRNYKDLTWWAFVRADFLLRDEKSGVLEKMVRAGFIHAMIGVERESNEELNRLDKAGYSNETVKGSFAMLKNKFPAVFRQGSLVSCFPFDTRESVLKLQEYCRSFPIDYPAFEVAEPLPGTRLYQDAKDKQLLPKDLLSSHDWINPAMRSCDGLSAESFAEAHFEAMKRYAMHSFVFCLKEMFSRHPHRRRLYRWFSGKIVWKIFWKALADKLEGWSGKRRSSQVIRLRKPHWYER